MSRTAQLPPLPLVSLNNSETHKNNDNYTNVSQSARTPHTARSSHRSPQRRIKPSVHPSHVLKHLLMSAAPGYHDCSPVNSSTRNYPGPGQYSPPRAVFDENRPAARHKVPSLRHDPIFESPRLPKHRSVSLGPKYDTRPDWTQSNNRVTNAKGVSAQFQRSVVKGKDAAEARQEFMGLKQQATRNAPHSYQ
eukprot:PhM_4_TR17860/c0_g1_i1/m.61736